MADAVTSKKLDTRTKFFYGLGAAPYGIKDNGFSYFLLIFYSQVLGLSPLLTSAALAIAIVVDALTDPVIGYISDNWHSRWGRRHPFMYAAIVPICATYAFMWNPPEIVLGDQTLLFTFLIIMAVSIRIFITFFEVPNTALISELTDDYDDRTGMMGLRYMFGWLGGIGMAVFGYAYFFRSAGENGLLQAQGYVGYGIAAAVLMFIGMSLSSLGTHRNIKNLHIPPARSKVTLRMVFAEIIETMLNHSFLALFLASIFAGTATGMQAALSIYFNTFFWGLMPTDLGIFSIFHALAAVCAVPVVQYLGRRFDKRRAAMSAFIFMISFMPLMFGLRLLDVLPDNGTSALFYMLLAHTFIEVGGIIVFFALFGSMMADVVEDSAVATARRSEGVIFAARSFAGKMVSGLGILLAGLVLWWASLPRGAKPEDVAPEVLVKLVLLAVPMQITLYLLALAMLSRYRITRGKHNENVAHLSA